MTGTPGPRVFVTGTDTGVGKTVVAAALVRAWQGVDHHVTVTTDGFEYRGRRFKSLSAIANIIAGTRWNGWTFFGVTNPNKREKRQ